ncbi:MAG: DEAD/DEAH box helicase [Deltaproteobacteria bacterium]|nr:DEAD/DEAH box helicase [Deltaproteobacteria bacterium]
MKNEIQAAVVMAAPTDAIPDASAPESAANTPPPSWNSLGLSAEALELIKKSAYASPTPVQAEAIPPALDGFDLIVSAQTGTGKTASFVLPMVEAIAGRQGTYGLILAPTREIAQQIQATLELFATPRGVRSVTLIGGIDLKLDFEALRTYPQIIVATPGRLCDHIERGTVWLDFIEYVVLDEADRMLDMGFSSQLDRIMIEVPKQRQMMLFSATFPPNVEALARKTLYQPKRIAIGRPTVAAKTVEQRLIFTQDAMKHRELKRLLREEKGSVMVFVRSKVGASRLFHRLHADEFYDVTCIHSDLLQKYREQSLADFKGGKYRILIATDVVGRGIHVEAVAHVVNYDLPLEPEDYIHRIGRTGRLDATGRATSFVTPGDRRLLTQIERLIGKQIPTGFAGDHQEPRSDEVRGKNRNMGARNASGGGGNTGGGGAQRRGRRGGRGRRVPGGSGAGPG